MKLLVASDLHFMDAYPHALSFTDGRVEEREAIEDAIVDAAEGCEAVLLNGDNFNVKNPSASTIRAFTAFLERFGNKKVIVNVGNHSNSADGKSAEDYLKEIKGKDWHVVNNDVMGFRLDDAWIKVVPYFRPAQFNVETQKEMVEKVMDIIEKDTCDVLAAHHCLTGTDGTYGLSSDSFEHEAVFPTDRLLKVAKFVVGGHVHVPQDHGNVSVVGSAMNMSIGEEDDKRVLVFDLDKGTRTSVELPGRKLYKLVNPTKEDIANKFHGGVIGGLVKVVFTGEKRDDEVVALLQNSCLNAPIVVEQPPDQRKPAALTSDPLDMRIEELLQAYAKEHDEDRELILKSFDRIRK